MQILDIHAFCNFIGEDKAIRLGLDDMSFDSGIKEEEVLVAKGMRISKKDIKIV